MLQIFMTVLDNRASARRKATVYYIFNQPKLHMSSSTWCM